MVYLYAGLGIAMLSGIIAIFEMGLAVTGQSLFEIESRYHNSNYFKNSSPSSVRSDDINLMQKLSNGTWREEYLAKNPGSQPRCSDLSVLYAPGTIWDRVSPKIDSPCESYGDGRRIVVDIVADEVLYICIPKQDLGKCFFEEKS